MNVVLIALPGGQAPSLARHIMDEFPVDARAFEFDLTDVEQLQYHLPEILSAFPVDFLINNAGIGGTANIAETTIDQIDRIIQLNVRTTALLTRMMIPHLLQHERSHILNISSMAAFTPIAYKTVYPASKAFITSFSLGLREEFAGTGLSVSVACPGPILTNSGTARRIIGQGLKARLGLLPTHQIARVAIRLTLTGQPVIIPGIANRISHFLMQLMPGTLRLRLISREVKKKCSTAYEQDTHHRRLGPPGANLTRELYRLGHDLRLLVRPTANLRTLADIPAELFHGDINDPLAVSNAVAGCEYVVHAASITGQWGISFEEYERVNFTGTVHIAEACRARSVRKLIYVSTANTLGHGTKKEPGNELAGFSLFSAGSGYINSKYLAQQYILEQVEKHGLPAVVVNPTFIIGPYDVRSSGRLLLHGIRSPMVWCPPGGKNFVHVADVCRGIAQAIEKGKPGDCYLLAGENLTYREFFRIVGQATGRKPWLLTVPSWALRLGGMIGSLAGSVTGRRPKLNNTTARLLCMGNYYSGRKSERELGMRYVSAKRAVTDACAWLKENDYF